MSKIIFSIDFEKFTGLKNNYEKNFNNKLNEYYYLKFLNLFKKYKIPCTIAIVGKLFDKKRELINILNFLRENKKIFEIASHSYSHYNYLISKEEFKQDLLNFRFFEAENNLTKSETFIYPRNEIIYPELLLKYGWKNIRLRTNSFSYNIKNISISNFLKLNEHFFVSTPHLYENSKLEKLYSTTGSICLISSQFSKFYSPFRKQKKRIIKGIKKSIKINKIFHIWTHDYLLLPDPDKSIIFLEKILKVLNEYVINNKIEVVTINNNFKTYD